MRAEFRFNGKIASVVDYSNLIEENGNKKTILIPETCKPQAVNAEMLKFCSGEVNVIMHGCTADANSLEKMWLQFEKDGFPLEKMAEGVLALELYGYAKRGLMPHSTFLIEIVRMIEAMNACKGIDGAEQRIRKAKKRLQGMTESRKNAGELFSAIMTITDEFSIARELNNLGYPIRFTDDRGADFVIDGHKTIPLDAKSRLNRDYDGTPSSKTANISAATLAALVCRDAYTIVEDAFEKQGASIGLVDLTHSQYGPIFLQAVEIENKDSGLDKAMRAAMDMVNAGKKSVVVYARASGSKPRMAAIALDSETVADLGRSIDKIEVVSKKPVF